MTKQTTIETTDTVMNKRIDMACRHIPGKPTPAKVMNMILVSNRPSQEYLKAYLKLWWS